MKDHAGLCSICYNTTSSDPCPICSDPHRDHRIVAVVERPSDVAIFERMAGYKFEGVYHVLHGAISPVNSISPNDLKVQELMERVDKGDIEEVIIATNPGQEGDATAFYIQMKLKAKGVKITMLGRGLIF